MVTTLDAPPQVVYVCPLCEAVQPVGLLPSTGGRRVPSGLTECYECKETVVYGPASVHLCSGALMLVSGILFGAAFLVFARRYTSTLVVASAGSAVIVLAGACTCCYGLCLSRLPRFARTVWTPRREGGDGDGDADLPPSYESAA